MYLFTCKQYLEINFHHICSIVYIPSTHFSVYCTKYDHNHNYREKNVPQILKKLYYKLSQNSVSACVSSLLELMYDFS